MTEMAPYYLHIALGSWSKVVHYIGILKAQINQIHSAVFVDLLIKKRGLCHNQGPPTKLPEFYLVHRARKGLF